MKNQLKRLVVALLAVVLVFSVTPVNAKAATGTFPMLGASVSCNGMHQFDNGVCVRCYYVCPHPKASNYIAQAEDYHHHIMCAICQHVVGDEDCDYDCNGNCRKCGKNINVNVHRNVCVWPWPYCVAPYYWCYYPNNEIDLNRSAGTALPAYSLVTNVGGAKVDMGAILASAKDQANQQLVANTLLGSLGFTKLTPTATYRLMPYNAFIPYGQQTAITWSNCGLKAGDTAFVVYWSPTMNTQLIPATVWPTGAATFTIPETNGAIVTLVKCN